MVLRSAPSHSVFFLALIFLFSLTSSSCAQSASAKRTEQLFKSVCTLSLYDHASEASFKAVWERLREIDSMMNMWDEHSALSLLNSNAGRGPQPVPPELVSALIPALELSLLSGGLYDPTVGPLVKLWAVGTREAAVPEPSAIGSALALIDWQAVKVQEADTQGAAPTIDLMRSGMALDFGSLAKGYGAREAARILSARGVKKAIIDIGGCIIALGSNPKGRPWKIGVQDPSGERGSQVIGYFLAKDQAADTSGIYERYFEQDAQKYHHIMDTKTGYPVENDLQSVSLLIDWRTNSDGPPLALLAMGSECGLELANRMAWAVVFIRRDKTVLLSKAAKKLFVLTSSEYKLIKE
ncbi:FAD:protein FMN transferase [Treponema sp.]